MFRVIIQTLSSDRLGTYMSAAGHNVGRAMDLYIWNAHIGEAFHTPIQTVEVALRNSVNHALLAKFGANWWAEPTYLRLLDHDRRTDLNVVLRRVRKRGHVVNNGQIVAGLSFGFWIGMLQPRYNPDIWSAHLRTSFPNLPPTETRHSLCSQAGRIANLRNRISHHEPIFNRDLLKDFSELMTLLSWVCPTTEKWVRPHCRVPALMRVKP